jgi:hypothetical protein
MDASAYLRKQGWRGDGHSLDHSNRGIKKPLLVSKKVDVLGVGLNKHTTVSDQWWLRAFDQGLKKLGTGEQSALSQIQKHGVYRGGLYANFIKGERLEGSIGDSSTLPTPTSTGGANTPVIQQEQVKMAVDIPPVDKLERVVGNHKDQNSHDAMMHLLQHPEDAPAGMKKMLDRKRKRAERPAEKRARRKTERQQETKQNAKAKRDLAKQEGTRDEEMVAERKRLKMINRQADEYVHEAQRQWLIGLGPLDIQRGVVATGANADAVRRPPPPEMQQVFDQLGLKPRNWDTSSKRSLKADKLERERLKRELKRAAKAYLTGEKPVADQTPEERMEKEQQKRAERAQKKLDAAKADAERAALREENAALKAQRRIEKKKRKEEINRIIAEREAVKTAAEKKGDDDSDSSSDDDDGGVNIDNNGTKATSAKHKPDDFITGADEISLNPDRKGGTKKIPGVGEVSRYPSKAEKRARKIAASAIREGITEDEVKARIAAQDVEKESGERAKVERHRAMKQGMSVEEYREALANGKVFTPEVMKKNLSPEKLKEYQARAAAKGLKLEEYIRQREAKNTARKSLKMENSWQKDISVKKHEGMNGDGSGDVMMEGGRDGPSFIIDTEGDSRLENANGTLEPVSHTRGILGDSTNQPVAVVDTAGDMAFAGQSNMPVPLDPRIWEGKVVKDLPKAVRKARQQWMANRRLERKQLKLERKTGKKVTLEPKKSKGQRKVEAREAFVHQVLDLSRKKLLSGGYANYTTVEGVENVPLVNVTSTEGKFKKEETDLARTVARRVLRNLKREERASKGKEKGYKKRERREKDAARERGISGFTTKARMDASKNGNSRPDLML